MDKLHVYILIVGLFTCVQASIKIKELKVPSSVQLDSTDDIILDCIFEASKDDSLEIKWFYNGLIEQVYQWIPEGNKHGYALGRLKGRLDLEYNVTNDTKTMYRGMKIKNISQDLSGNYTCKVSSDFTEAYATKQLTIYSPAESGLDIIMFKQEALVICTVNGISPVPEVDFYIEKENGTQIDINEEIDSIPDNDGKFNVTAKHYFDNATLNDPMKFVCNVSIPGTDYYLTKTMEYQIGNSTRIHSLISSSDKSGGTLLSPSLVSFLITPVFLVLLKILQLNNIL